MMELLGPMPKSLALSGTKYKKMFNSNDQLKRINGLNYWPLHKVLHEKYRFKEDNAKALADFLVPMLEWNPEKRASAQQMLNHPWLQMESNYDNRFTKEEMKEYKEKKKAQDKISENENQNVEMSKLLLSETGRNEADNEMLSTFDLSDYTDDSFASLFEDSDESLTVMPKKKTEKKKKKPTDGKKK
jgi:serine/threonine-protein kinase SRPK3